MIFQLLERLHQAHHLTSIFVTHNWSFAVRCDRVLMLEGGCLVPGGDDPSKLGRQG
jgi:lipoprotein-releasing system ATP-binding protein